MKFELKQNHVDRGIPGSSEHCLFALAISDHLNENGVEHQCVSVDYDTVAVFFKDSSFLTYYTSEGMVETAQTFDWIGREYARLGIYEITLRKD